MKDPRLPAARLLEDRGQRDAAGVLSRCRVEVRHVDPPADLSNHDQPEADLLIVAPHKLASCVLEGRPPESNWGNEIERALRESARGHYRVRDIQWIEHDPEPARGRIAGR